MSPAAVLAAFDAAHIKVSLFEEGLLFAYDDPRCNGDMMIAAYRMLAALPGNKAALIEYLESGGA